MPRHKPPPSPHKLGQPPLEHAPLNLMGTKTNATTVQQQTTRKEDLFEFDEGCLDECLKRCLRMSGADL